MQKNTGREKRIAFAGTDGRTLLWAHVVSSAQSEKHPGDYHGVVVRGAPAMPKFVKILGWPVSFVSTKSNSVEDYANAIVSSLESCEVDYVVPMPETLFFEGIVDRVREAGFGRQILGLSKKASFIESDKILAKEMCQEAGIPVAPAWSQADARDYKIVLKIVLEYISKYGGAVLKYPYSAGGKGARIILNTWEVRQVYDQLIHDYKKSYLEFCGDNKPWPLLIESRMSGVEISFTVLVDMNGNFQILPTSMDYPERFEGGASKDNPITGGTGAISPHPMESPGLIEMARQTIIKPLIEIMRKKGHLRPCILYPGCFVSMKQNIQPSKIRVCEINIRPGEPEAQPLARRLRNLGPLIAAAMEGNLDQVKPEVREDQISACITLMTGPGGPDGQKGYPWSCTKGEECLIDFAYMKKKGIQLVPSAMDESEGKFISDGSRVAFLNANISIKDGDEKGEAANRLRIKLLSAYDNGKIRVVPREDKIGNRLALRRDIGEQYRICQEIFPE